jgi:hypothetical protein
MYLVAYNRDRALELLRTATPEQLRNELRMGRMGRQLNANQRAELDDILMAWEQRALGAMPLRDTLLVDTERGPRAYGLICADLSVERAPLPPTIIGQRPAALGDLTELPARFANDDALQAVVQAAQSARLTLAIQRTPTDFSIPPNLEALLPPEPQPFNPMLFDPPRGWRRTLAVVFATSGMALLGLPFLAGQVPEHPAGLPLALITLALMVGIRAGRAGYLGALCIWMVAQLPSFRHDTTASLLWPALPLLAAGLLLLSVDRRVRAMWAWIRRQLFGMRPSSKSHQ